MGVEPTRPLRQRSWLHEPRHAGSRHEAIVVTRESRE